MTSDKNSGRSGRVSITGGVVMTGGGDIFGGDKVQFIAASALEHAFSPVAQAIEGSAVPDRPAAMTTLTALKAEAAKGKNADDTVLAELLKGLVKLVPDGIGAIGHAFGMPILDGLAGPATKRVLDSILGH
jgi:hypothetical protein